MIENDKPRSAGPATLGKEGGAAASPRLSSTEVWLCVAVTIALIWAVLAFYGSVYAVHHDLAGGLLGGQLATVLGSTFDEYSLFFPPAERGWFSLAAQISAWSGFSLKSVIVFLTAGLAVVSAGLAFVIRRQSVGASTLFYIAPLAFLLIFPIAFKNVFGLREHIVALGLWPYLVMRVSDPDATQTGKGTRIAVGVWMGATLLFKYLYAIVVLLLELADAAAQRRVWLLFRIENLLSGSIVAVYLLFWLVLDPSQRETIGILKSAIDANLREPADNAMEAVSWLLLASALLLAARIARWPWRPNLMGLALVAGAVIVAAIQARWYSHHLFPITLAYLVWWWMISRHPARWGHAVLALCILVPVVPQTVKTASYQAEVREIDGAMKRAGIEISDMRVGILTTHPSPYSEYLVARGGLRWIVSVNNSYVAAELKPLDVPANTGRDAPPVTFADPGRRLVHEEMLRLWEDMPPDALIIDNAKSWPLRHIRIDWMRVFANDARFQAIIEDYRPVLHHRGRRLDFTYYVRKTPPPAMN